MSFEVLKSILPTKRFNSLGIFYAYILLPAYIRIHNYDIHGKYYNSLLISLGLFGQYNACQLP